ncbi:macrolide ABC transporter ATP-binding protein [Ahniella affigens]|uniref:Macrolide ABC transporter ATP-binding protein n=1 Tax=Ahniella affigens TaxID=2021234 RepID=A0A2P1PVD8_9GAMM|nr:ABC transporter ATP-binding protein [Ahniella affigens]AVP98790.1 macrolide ABC transporter ATP-binding protein [Ahniella affigens]
MINIEEVEKTYLQGGNTIRALAGVSLKIAAGEHVAILGPSGSGKSTLLNVLGALDHPDRGHYRFEGEDISRYTDDQASTLRNERIGFVFQSFHLLPRLTVLENVLLPLRYARKTVPDAETRARSLLERVGLADRIEHRPGELSGGQMQRVAIARALLMHPPLLLADEPTGNLDSKSATDVLALLDELNRDGQTLVIVTHDATVAERAKRRVYLRDGLIEREEHA